MFICVLSLAVIFFVIPLLFEDRIQKQWLLGIVVFDIVLWAGLSISQFEIEIPYQLYNATSGAIETGYQSFTSNSYSFLYYIFLAPALIMFIYMNYMVFTAVLNVLRKAGLIRKK
jgi:hypothetical protein